MRNVLNNKEFKNVFELYQKQEQLWLDSDMDAHEILNARQAFVAAYEEQLTPVFEALFGDVEAYNVSPQVLDRIEKVKEAGCFSMVMDFANLRAAKLQKSVNANADSTEEQKGKINTIQAIIRNAEGDKVNAFRADERVKADPFENSGLTNDQIQGLKQFHQWLNRNCDKSGFEYFGSNGNVRQFADKFMRMPLNQQLEALYLVDTNKRKNESALNDDDHVDAQNYVPNLKSLKGRMVAHWTKFWRRTDGSQFYWNKLQQAMNIAEKHAEISLNVRVGLNAGMLKHELHPTENQEGMGKLETTGNALQRIKDYNGKLLLKTSQIESGIKQNMNAVDYYNGKLTDEELKDAPKTFFDGEKYVYGGLKAIDALGAGLGAYKATKEAFAWGVKSKTERTVDAINAVKSLGVAADKLAGATTNLTALAIGKEAMKKVTFIGGMAEKLETIDKFVPVATGAIDTTVDVIKLAKGFDKNKHLNKAKQLIDESGAFEAGEKKSLKAKVNMLKRINKRKMKNDAKDAAIDGTLLTVASVGAALPVANVAVAGLVSVAKLASSVENNLRKIDSAKESRADVLNALDKPDDNRIHKFENRFRTKFALYENTGSAREKLDAFRNDPLKGQKAAMQIHKRNAIDANSTTLNNYVDKKVDQFADEIAANVYGKTLEEHKNIQDAINAEKNPGTVITNLKEKTKNKHTYVSHTTYKEMLKGTGTRNKAIETEDAEEYKKKYARRKDKIAKNIKDTILQK